MSVRANVLLWAQRVVGRKATAAHLVLEIAPDADAATAQEAFYKIARLAHPDLHRTTLTPDELELVTSAYARAAAAYQEFRTGKFSTTRIKPLVDAGSSPIPTAVTSPSPNKSVPIAPMSASPSKSIPIAPMSASASKALPVCEDPPSAPPAMTSKALVHYRKAELCLRRGDLAQAVLHLKMAIASDPQSTFLRTALTEVEAEVRKKP